MYTHVGFLQLKDRLERIGPMGGGLLEEGRAGGALRRGFHLVGGDPEFGFMKEPSVQKSLNLGVKAREVP